MRNGHYAPIHLHRDGDGQTDRHRDAEVGDRHRDMEILKYPSSGIGWRASSVGSVRRSVGSVRFGLIL